MSVFYKVFDKEIRNPFGCGVGAGELRFRNVRAKGDARTVVRSQQLHQRVVASPLDQICHSCSQWRVV